MPEEADARLQLTPTQQALYDALLEKPGGLAELYRAAIAILNDATIPDRLALAAHELRELLEKLPGEEVDLGAGLNDKVKELEPLWKNANDEEKAAGREPWTGQVTQILRTFLVATQRFFEERTRISDIERRTRAPLTSWTRTGFLETTPGAEIDMNVIIERVRWASRMFDVREVTFDRWGGIKAAATLMLVPEGFICVDIPQTIGGLTAATKQFIGLYMNRKLAHGNNPILNWHASCLALVTDGGDNCKPAKPPRDTASKRIDGVAATITAMARAVFAEENTITYTGLRSVG